MCQCNNRCKCLQYDGKNVIYTGNNISTPVSIQRGDNLNELVQKLVSFEIDLKNVATVGSASELNTFNDPNIMIVFVMDDQTTFLRKTGVYTSDSGSVLIQGTTDEYWVPQFYKTPQNGVVMGNSTMTNSDGYFNSAILKVISQPTSNAGLLSLGTDTAKVSGIHINNIDYGDKGYSPEFWAKGCVLPTDWTTEAAVTWRAIISGQHTRQLGFGINSYTTGGDTTRFWTNATSMRDDAIIFWVSNNDRYNQSNVPGLALKNSKLQFYVTGSGDAHVKGALYTGSLVFTTNTIVSHQAAAYVFKGGSGVTLTLPDPLAIDIWGALEFENLELTLVNLGTDVLSLSRPVRLDASDTIDQLNYMTPNNRIRIKCVGGEWIKIVN